MVKSTERKMDKGEQTKKSILDAALKLFARDGYESATMRAVADEAGLALGATYYYFRSKGDLIHAFYQSTAQEAQKQNPEFISLTKSFEERFRSIIEFKFEQLFKNRELVKVLAQHGVDFSHPLSPFSKESASMRRDAIALIEEAIEGSNFKCSKLLRPHVATVLWIYQLGITLFWANDKSVKQQKTKDLLSLSLPMLNKLLKLSSLPLLYPVNKAFEKIVSIIISSFENEIDKKCLEKKRE